MFISFISFNVIHSLKNKGWDLEFDINIPFSSCLLRKKEVTGRVGKKIILMLQRSWMPHK
jgi:hypothetical protein